MFKMNKKGWVTAAALAVLAGNVQAQAVAPFSNTSSWFHVLGLVG